MTNALIGASGFVGTTLLKVARFEAQFRSTNIDQIDGEEFDIVVCAGARAQKWIANRDPMADRVGIDQLIGHLKKVKCRRFVLISTVDVFREPRAVDERTAVEECGLQPYGLHRRMLEKFVEDHFVNCLVVRLPGLVGPGLRKNAIFDLLNNNQMDKIDSRGIFQFYPMVNLWYDLLIALDSGLRLLHLTAEPVSLADVSQLGFGRPFDNRISSSPVRYDMRSLHANLFGGIRAYQYSSRETLQAVRTYAQSELTSPAGES